MDNESGKSIFQKFFKDYLIIFLITVITITITVFICSKLYDVSRKSIINMWNSNIIIKSQEIEYYLSEPASAVNFTAKRVETMIEDGATYEEINACLIEESEVYANLIDSNATGIYGFCKGRYLDGSGWVPPKGYAPKERPWYVDAVKADGEVVYVEPYINVQTNTMMMSVSKLLEDKESVISMDFFLDSIQNMDTNMVTDDYLETAMVIDSDGAVIAHSDSNQIGNDFSKDGVSFHKAILEGIIGSGENSYFFATDHGSKKLVMYKSINKNWYTVFIFDYKHLFHSIQYIVVVAVLIITYVLGAFLVTSKTFEGRHTENTQLQNELLILADVYLSISVIDLNEMKAKQIWVSDNLSKILASDDYSLESPEKVARVIAVEPCVNMVTKFMDLSTLNDRLKDLKTISLEFINKENKWVRMRFFADERDKEGNLVKVIWATESIDEDKKTQEELRKKAETDKLTGILNRSGGETKLFTILENGKKGMLLIIDADNFKYVNDNFGHDVGDMVIKSLANCLSDTFRESDVVFRLGGDEFCVFASGIEYEEFGRIAIDRLFMNINNIIIPETKGWKIKISVGATFVNKGKVNSFTELYKEADKAMYESKQKEGNYVTFYKPENE